MASLKTRPPRPASLATSRTGSGPLCWLSTLSTLCLGERGSDTRLLWTDARERCSRARISATFWDWVFVFLVLPFVLGLAVLFMPPVVSVILRCVCVCVCVRSPMHCHSLARNDSIMWIHSVFAKIEYFTTERLELGSPAGVTSAKVEKALLEKDPGPATANLQVRRLFPTGRYAAHLSHPTSPCPARRTRTSATWS
jgi:hypothetical protein